MSSEVRHQGPEKSELGSKFGEGRENNIVVRLKNRIYRGGIHG